MQKIIIVTLALDQLSSQPGNAPKGAATVHELPEIDTLLEQGWLVTEYKVLHTDPAKNTLFLSVLLDDGADPDDPLYEFDEEELDIE
ncbi:hypothetical protein DCC81_09455 [Chitinophaga parva]|uniref:DUF4177 domain-containing protein n=1 Tax=Chitinophaga parva TaxID=2169414 RepID=A0A2T7BPP3_9BACT|nr:hypothetical protein [Chitinophaga parva]PUZ29647.1 hypothetical protein DCC81_09455 [Chitinophaga parva]